jgi:hypothetical protein
MSALDQKQTSRHVPVVSVIPLKADIHQRGLHVRLVQTSGNIHNEMWGPPIARNPLVLRVLVRRAGVDCSSSFLLCMLQ